MKIPAINGQTLLNRLLEVNSVGVFVYNRELKICEWNSSMEKLTGLYRIDCLEKELFAVVRTSSPGPDETEFRQALEGKQFVLKSKSLIVSNGHTKEKKFDFFAVPLDEPDKKINCVAVIALEAEEEKVKIAVERQKAVFRSLNSFLTYAPMPVFIIDKDFRVQLANEAFNQLFESENAIGRLLDELLTPEMFGQNAIEKSKKVIKEVIETQKLDVSHEQYSIGGKEQHFYIIRFPIGNARGKVDAIGGYAIEITEEVEQEQKIQQLLSDSVALNEELETRNEELEEGREHLKAANKRLKLKRQKLKLAMKELSDRNFELDQIMYKTSHDLRSPLTSILGLLSLAKLEKDPAKLPEYFTYMEDRVAKLDNFVKSMLSYAKTSRMEVQPVEVPWEELVADSLSNLEYMANFKHIRIIKEYNCGEHIFKSDLLRLRIVFNNLLGNAIKYADLRKPEPFIHIQVEALPGEAVISIKDNGIGIEKKYMPEIGKMFFRATEKSEGSGLGMYIVKQAIERLEGSFQISSESGKGTSILIKLPILEKPSL
jgi:PAS domain S-box-containing protein